MEVEALSDANLPRATQLLNKTNHMNLATRRMTEPEFKAWAEAEGHKVWTVRVSDRFGDYGLTGIVSLAPATASGRPDKVMAIRDFLLSCRVFGRKVEEAMVHVAATAAQNAGASTLEATLLPTAQERAVSGLMDGALGL